LFGDKGHYQALNMGRVMAYDKWALHKAQDHQFVVTRFDSDDMTRWAAETLSEDNAVSCLLDMGVPIEDVFRAVNTAKRSPA
jgi:hypothetical protein